jgi:hypothetical protein
MSRKSLVLGPEPLFVDRLLTIYSAFFIPQMLIERYFGCIIKQLKRNATIVIKTSDFTDFLSMQGVMGQ